MFASLLFLVNLDLDFLWASVYKKNIPNDSSLIIDTKNFTNGIYFFVLNTDKGFADKKKVIFSN